MKIDRFLYSRTLSAIRGSDYAHPGEEEGIERVLNYFQDYSARILDLGCGIGGTANYIAMKGWKNIVGIDCDGASVQYAREKYPSIKFVECDAAEIEERLGLEFDIILIMNMFYLIRDKSELLKKLFRIAHSKTTLIISDYLDLGDYDRHRIIIQDNDVIPYPLKFSECREIFRKTGWSIKKENDISHDYLKWYKNFVQRIDEKKVLVYEMAGKHYYDYISSKYSQYVKAISAGFLGGAIIVAAPVGGALHEKSASK